MHPVRAAARGPGPGHRAVTRTPEPLRAVPPIPADAAARLDDVPEPSAWLWRCSWAWTHALGVDTFDDRDIRRWWRMRRRYPDDPEAAGLADARRVNRRKGRP